MKCIEHTFNELIKAFNSFDFFYPVFGLTESRKQVGNVKQIVFEILTKEQGHNIPHLHACYEGKNISISLVDFSILALNSKKTRVISNRVDKKAY